MPFRTALSGLNAASSELRMIGNNVANAATNGFKKSTIQFADVFAVSNLGTASDAIGSGVRVASVTQQFSQGNVEFSDNVLDLAVSGQGFFRINDGGAISYTRAGAFEVDREGYIVNSSNQRLTGFMADDLGNITGALGDIRLDSSDIAPLATSRIGLSLNLNAGATVPAAPVPSSVIQLGSTGASMVLDPADSPVNAGPLDLVDNYGNLVPGVQLQFTNTGGNTWQVSLIGATGTSTPATFEVGVDNTISLNWNPDGAGPQNAIDLNIDVSMIVAGTGPGTSDLTASSNGQVQGPFDRFDATTYNNSTSLTVYDSLGTPHLATVYYRRTAEPNQWESYMFIGDQLAAGGQANGADLLQFDADGRLVSINGTPTPPNIVSLATIDPGSGAGPMTLNVDYGAISQWGGGFNVVELSQDGYTTGRLNSIDIDASGIVFARFTNGQTRTLAQIALVNFANPQGLSQLGNTSWGESFESGPPLVAPPGSSGLGLIQSGALEGSNVDLTEQLVRMITSQRNFQANAQVIQTADTITQSIINLR
jgi:flagellar hook protein FlgE